MADKLAGVNTTAENGETKQEQELAQLSNTDTDSNACDNHTLDRDERSPSDSSWSAPLLSLARKATETLSSGVSYASGRMNSAENPEAEKEPEIDPTRTGKKLPGRWD